MLKAIFATRASVAAVVTLVAATVNAVFGLTAGPETVEDVTNLVFSALAIVSSGWTVTKLASLVDPMVKVVKDAMDGDPNT